MGRIFISQALIIIYFNIPTYKQDIQRQYQAELNEFTGKIDIKICSEGIIEYCLDIRNEIGNSVFKQEGFAIFPNRKEQIKYGREQIEKADNEFVSAEQYFELCDCKKWLTIKVALDYSLVKVDCTETLINEIFGKRVNSNLSKHSFGNFYLKKQNLSKSNTKQ